MLIIWSYHWTYEQWNSVYPILLFICIHKDIISLELVNQLNLAWHWQYFSHVKCTVYNCDPIVEGKRYNESFIELFYNEQIALSHCVVVYTYRICNEHAIYDGISMIMKKTQYFLCLPRFYDNDIHYPL